MGATVAQWWERSPPTNVARVRILASAPYVGWVCCWFSPLLQEVFLRILRFSPLLKNKHFQIPIRFGTHGHVSTSSHELLSLPWVNKLQLQLRSTILSYIVYVRCKDHKSLCLLYWKYSNHAIFYVNGWYIVVLPFPLTLLLSYFILLVVILIVLVLKSSCRR